MSKATIAKPAAMSTTNHVPHPHFSGRIAFRSELFVLWLESLSMGVRHGRTRGASLPRMGLAQLPLQQLPARVLRQRIGEYHPLGAFEVRHVRIAMRDHFLFAQ